jgi:hypothetical protein
MMAENADIPAAVAVRPDNDNLEVTDLFETIHLMTNADVNEIKYLAVSNSCT